MTREERWRAEWEVLRAERRDARRRWCGAVDGLAARARDPLGLRRLVGDHPVAAAGIGAGIAALLAGWLRRRASPGENGDRPGIPWATALKDAALRAAVPWLASVAEEILGGGPTPPPRASADRGSPPAS